MLQRMSFVTFFSFFAGSTFCVSGAHAQQMAATSVQAKAVDDMSVVLVTYAPCADVLDRRDVDAEMNQLITFVRTHTIRGQPGENYLQAKSAGAARMHKNPTAHKNACQFAKSGRTQLIANAKRNAALLK